MRQRGEYLEGSENNIAFHKAKITLSDEIIFVDLALESTSISGYLRLFLSVISADTFDPTVRNFLERSEDFLGKVISVLEARGIDKIFLVFNEQYGSFNNEKVIPPLGALQNREGKFYFEKYLFYYIY